MATDLRDWCALDLTGCNDNAGIVQDAFDQTASCGEELHIPSGKIAIGCKISMPHSLRVVGPGSKGLWRDGGDEYPDAVFYITHDGVGFEAKGNGSARSMRGISTLRTQPEATSAAYNPANNGFDFDIVGAYDVSLSDINLINPTRGIRTTGDTETGQGCGRLSLTRIKGQPLYKGIELHNCYDVVWMDEVGFWPFWSNEDSVRRYMRTYGHMLYMCRVDNPKVGRIFGIGYRYTIRVGADENNPTLPGLPGGTVSKGYFDCVGGDSAGTVLQVESGAVCANLVFDKLYGHSGAGFMGIGDSYLLRDCGQRSYISVGNLELGQNRFSLVYQDGVSGVLLADRVKIYQWDLDNSGDAAFQNTPGNRMILGPIVRSGSNSPVFAASNAAGISSTFVLTQ